VSSLDPQPQLLLWAGSVRPLPLEERIRVAQIGGFRAMSMFPWDVRREVAAGRGLREIHNLLAAEGVPVSVLDPVTTWLPASAPGSESTVFEREFASDSVDSVFAMASELGADLVCAAEFWGVGVEREEGAEAFARLCDRAASHGLRVGLEPMPFSGISDLGRAWQIVELADRRNGGLTLDSWHFFRRGADLDLLAGVPADRIFALQLNDAPREPWADVKLESMDARLLPGEGELPLADFLGAVGTPAADCAIGPEIFNEEIWATPPAELARRLAATTRDVLASSAPADGGVPC
jgi:sugar phosphate isomerase/epimerase